MTVWARPLATKLFAKSQSLENKTNKVKKRLWILDKEREAKGLTR